MGYSVLSDQWVKKSRSGWRLDYRMRKAVPVIPARYGVSSPTSREVEQSLNSNSRSAPSLCTPPSLCLAHLSFESGGLLLNVRELSNIAAPCSKRCNRDNGGKGYALLMPSPRQ